MIKKFLTLPLFALFVLALPPLAYAEEEAAAIEKDGLVEAQEKSIEKMHELLEVLVEPLSDGEKKHFFHIYDSYKLIGTVHVVHSGIKDTVKECGKKNPDIKSNIEARFKDWDGAVMSVLGEAQGHLDNMVLAQEYAKKRDIKAVFKSIEDTRAHTEARFERVPVTTLEACEYLLGKMDDTQENLIGLLRSTLVSYPQERPVKEDTQDEPPEDL